MICTSMILYSVESPTELPDPWSETSSLGVSLGAAISSGVRITATQARQTLI